jgi:diaminopimelate decarboxylase
MCAVAARSQVLADPRVTETIALRRCAQYRKAFRCAAVSYPSGVLSLQAPAEWVKRHGVAVDVADTDGVALALAAGVLPQRIIGHGSAMSQVAEAGAGRFVVNSGQQVGALKGAAPDRRRVLVDMTDQDADDLVAAVVAGAGLDLIGVHRRLRGGENGRAVVRAMIAAMRGSAGRYNIIPARLSLGNVGAADWGCERDDLAAIAAAIDDAVEDACIASRFPSPAVNVAPPFAALMPGN